MLRRISFLVLTLVLSLGSVLIFSTPAFAGVVKPHANTGPTNGGFICSTSATGTNIASNYLPINRWGNVSSSEFTYLAGGLTGTTENLTNQANRGIVSIGLSVGNAMWSTTSSLTTIAEQFCFGGQAALAANHVTAGLWKFLTTGAVFPILLSIALILIFWRARRGARIIKDLIRLLLVAGIIAALGVQSAKTTAADAQSGNYPVASPAWAVSTFYGALSAAVSAPLSGIDTLTSSVQLGKDSSSNGYGTGCPAYLNSLLTKYKQSYGINGATQSAAVVPEMVNDIWDSSGLQATAIAQFGDNNYTSSAYCHLYEQESGISPSSQIAIARAAGKIPPNPNPKALAFLPQGMPKSEEVTSLVGWAACTKPNSTVLKPSPTWSTIGYPPGTGLVGGLIGKAYQNAVGNQNITASDCQQWWSSPASSWNYQGTALYWGTSTSTIATATANAPQVSNFLLNFFGDTSNGATIVALVYAVSSLVVLTIFGVLALAVIVAKFGLLLLMALFILFLVADLIPGKGGGHHASKFLKQGISFTVLAIGAEALLGMVALLTNIIDRFGVGVAGSGLVGMLWIAISPVAAIWGLHHILKTFRIPSPLKPETALGWAAAGSAGGFMGGAIASRLTGGYQRLQSRGRAGLRSGVRGARRGLSTSPESRLGAPRMPSKDLSADAAGYRRGTGSGSRPTGTTGSGSKTTGTTGSGGRPTGTTGSGSKTTGGTRTASNKKTAGATSGYATSGGRRRFQTVSVDNLGKTTERATTEKATQGRQRKQAAANRALNKFKQKASGEPRSRWSLRAPAQKPTMINGKPYRTPAQMRLEGVQKRVNDRQVRKQAKQFIKAQRPGSRVERFKQAAHDRARLTYARAAANPGRTAKRAAAYGAAALLLPASAPVVGVALGAHYATKKIRTARAERPNQKAEDEAHLQYVERNFIRNKNTRSSAHEPGSVKTKTTTGKNQTKASYRRRKHPTTTT